MKKTLVVLFVFMLAVACGFANYYDYDDYDDDYGRGYGLGYGYDYGFGIGINAQYKEYSAVEEDVAPFALQNMKFGYEMRLKLGLLQVDTVRWYNNNDRIGGMDLHQTRSGYYTVGLNLINVPGAFSLSVGMGPMYYECAYLKRYGGSKLLYGNGSTVAYFDENCREGGIVQQYAKNNGFSMKKASWLMAPRVLKITGSFAIGYSAVVAVNMILPTEFNWVNTDVSKLIPRSFKDASIGLSVLWTY